MTLIASNIDRNGIVMATDSNLTDENDNFAGIARKNFELPRLRGGLNVAGCWSAAGVPMDEWMPRLIARPESHRDGTLAGFAECLRAALEAEMTDREKESGSI